MARPFTWKEIPALAVGESFVVRGGKRADVARKVSGYAGRCQPNRKLFSCVAILCPDARSSVRVTRLPDPEPEVA